MKLSYEYMCKRKNMFAEDDDLLNVVLSHLADIYNDIDDNIKEIDEIHITVNTRSFE